MERRLLLAIGLMVGLMVMSNVLFPPIPGPVIEGGDSTAVVSAPEATAPDSDAADAPGDGLAEQSAAAISDAPDQDVVDDEGPLPAIAAPAPQEQTILVESDLYRYRWSTRGARLVSAVLTQYPNFAPDRPADGPVELLRPDDSLLGFTIAMGADTVFLEDLIFEASTDGLDVTSQEGELTFTAPVGSQGVTFDVTYRFYPDNYRVDIDAGLRNVRGQGYAVLMSLGRGLRSNEATPREDFGQMALVTRTRSGDIASEGLDGIDPDEAEIVAGAPFSWAASKSKYFLATIVSDSMGPGFGGAILNGVEEEDAARMRVTLPVPAGTESFSMVGYLGPQDQDRLRAIGQELHNVNPFGWRILQWFIRPFGALVIDVLIWMHNAFTLAYGWVLILFGVASRIVLFPLYQISMRSQMKQMAIQPEIKRIQEKHKEDPQKLQQEMMKTYKENGVSPLGGCLPMMLPLPILITLFFVFQNTIEFRGVPFLWLPDLSLKDPIYVVPLLMGGSMLLLNWIGQRGMETNPQMKMFTYVLPVVFTFMFAQFASGLNLYYAASNIASLPQQLYLSKERRAQQAKTKGTTAGGGDSGGATAKGSTKASSGSAKGKRGQTSVGVSRKKRR